MPRPLTLLALSLSLGCHHAKPTSSPGDTVVASGAAASAIDAELVALARKPGAAIKFKLRVDDRGSVTKQSLYHNDAEAIPAAARTSAEQRWAGGSVVRYETELYAEHGRVFEIEVKTAEGQTCELAVKADGTALYEECQLAVDQLPAPVAAQITALFPQGKVLEAESKRGDGLDELTLEVESGGQEFYVRIKPDGTVLGKALRIPAILEVPLP